MEPLIFLTNINVARRCVPISITPTDFTMIRHLNDVRPDKSRLCVSQAIINYINNRSLVYKTIIPKVSVSEPLYNKVTGLKPVTLQKLRFRHWLFL